jgi:DNA polymerase III alpha subunit (gram-positive type)
MKKIYVDTEYMYEGMFYEKRMPKNSDKKQIIQIAAVLFDHDKSIELKSLDILVKPIFNEKLPDFFIELTNINDEMIKNRAIPFSRALKQFVDFCEDYPILTFNNDYNVFLQNFEFHSIDNPFKCPFIRVKPLLKNFGINPDKYSSGTLYKAVGLNLKSHVHYALHDVRSMSQAMDIIEKNANL